MYIKTAELRKLVQDKGVVGWETMKRQDLEKAIALPVNEVLKTPEVPVISETLLPKVREVDVNGIKETVAPVGSKAEKMKQSLAAQPKSRVFIPLGDGELKGSTESVILNGYRLNIRKGIYVDVPAQIAEILNDANSAKLEIAENPYRLLEEVKK